MKKETEEINPFR